MNKKLIQKLKEKLEEKKKILERELKKFAERDKERKDNWQTRYPSFDGGNLEEGADEVEEYVNRLPVEYSLELRLRDVNLALEKIKKGKYGICEKCQKPISQKRLMVSPEARFCMKCQK